MLWSECCENWFHPDCLDVELTDEVKKKARDFKCDRCDECIAFISKLKRKEGTKLTGPGKAPHLDRCEMAVDQPEQDDQPQDQNGNRWFARDWLTSEMFVSFSA